MAEDTPYELTESGTFLSSQVPLNVADFMDLAVRLQQPPQEFRRQSDGQAFKALYFLNGVDLLTTHGREKVEGRTFLLCFEETGVITACPFATLHELIGLND